MAFPAKIEDGTGSKTKAKVTEDHALLVTGIEQNAFFVDDDVLTRYKLLRAFMTNGTSKDMNVNGSVTPVEFTVTSDVGKVLYITQIRILINGTYFELDTQDFRRFGLATAGGGALPNGLTLNVEQGGIVTSMFADPVTQTGDFLNYADDFVNLKNSISAQSDFLSFDIHFEKPVVLPESVTDRMVMTVRDNLTSIDLFQVLVRGYQEVR